MRETCKNKNLITGAVLVFFLLLMLIISFFYLPYPPNEMDSVNTLAMPSMQHLLGTDNFGRDILSRIMKGSQMAFGIGFGAVIIGMTIGVILGAVAGYFGGWIDEIVMRFMDAKMAFPGVILALVLITVFGNGIGNMILALGIMSIPRFCRMTRTGFMQVKEMEYIKAAKSRGISDFRIMIFHILPNISSSLLVTFTLGISSAILSEAGLSFLGLGIQPPHPSWGRMLFEAQSYLLTDPLYALIPGIMITILVLGFNLLGDGLRDYLDHRMPQREEEA